MPVRIQRAPFDPGSELATFGGHRTDAGAQVCFVGTVRSLPETPVESMTIEHYPGMTESAIAGHIELACQRWLILDCLVIHRFGDLRPGDAIVMVATLAAHRAEAFQAAEFLMDYLKSRAPFWKKEHRPDGSAWVPSAAEDAEALKRWQH